jgi:hypothetical protein
MAFLNAPTDIGSDSWAGVRTFARAIASVVNRINTGKINAVYRVAEADFTLTANAASSTLTDARLTAFSHVAFDPMTANAAAELAAGTLYVTSANRNNGSFVLTHANNAQTDRTFRVLIIG